MNSFICSFRQPFEIIILPHFTIEDTEAQRMLVNGGTGFDPRQPTSIPVLLSPFTMCFLSALMVSTVAGRVSACAAENECPPRSV